MKVFKISLLAALISSPLAAETIDKTWELGVFGDYIKSSTNKEARMDWYQVEAGKSIGIDLQKIINDYWNVRVEIAGTRYDIDNGTDKDYGIRGGVDAIYKLEDSNLYMFAGVKRFSNAKTYNAVNIGAGYNFEVNDRLSFYSEAAIYKDVDYGYIDQGVKLGLKYTFGDVKQAPVSIKPTVAAVEAVVAKVLDSDNDGVSDNIDRCANTPVTVKVDSMGCTLYSEQAVEIKLNIAFANNSSIVEPALVDDIQRLADFMKEYTNTSVEIEGHTSITGTADYNLMMSKKRAESVKSILVNKFNIDASRLTTKGYGQTQLLSTDNTIAAHKLNRRVVAKIATSVKEVVTKD
ncbi:OmpA family protein [Colwellia sp. MB3u-70]|uniref:OmpA family protein n=1 Tax=unclassified Colwellia TaxID=196834 RepID=UPI0015F6FF37|nr:MULTISPECIES: OmpA family protein [unclassified Colwellia]MBA6290987.1 OmpA family protein [Colwellia sp. MB3u-8]MBA6308294.1 OmpA family protein [Colwellia sp. MB3u-70]